MLSVPLPGVAFCLTRLRIRPIQEGLKNLAETEYMVRRGSENRGTTIVADAMPNKPLQLTPYSLRSAPASRRS